MEALSNIVRSDEGVNRDLITYAEKTTDGAPTASAVGFAVNAVIFNTFEDKKYVNTGTSTSATWTVSEVKDTVTQITSVSTGVTLNAKRGVITTFEQTLTANSEAEFVVTNSYVKTTSIILLGIQYATAKTGRPHAVVSALSADGAFSIKLKNVDASAALNDVVKIHMLVLN